MLPVHWRLAELWTIRQKRELTEAENTEMSLCLQLNANFARKLATLHNWSYTAALIGDTVWQHEICQRIEELESQYYVSGKIG
ncbi:DUF7667 family protein [Paenibacillus thalictri]|uniref:Uncharacterized protein n=1 Tax=Paenibacillus thalictri TaxID=2527873 RepID=A0A4V6MSJ3_9BACL|nr:hypothetical protein [Paenibacillus thalictri]TBL81272.1 hypothetical protein EYB31_04065 [Paenibacillus thalictri]